VQKPLNHRRKVGGEALIRLFEVKQKDKAGRPDIDSFEAVMVRENRVKGFFVSFGFSSDALSEIDSFFRNTGK